VGVWVALVRAINLGKRNRVPMAELRRVFEDAGCASVRTYIQSGNVLFQHGAPDRTALERVVAEEFGIETSIVLRSAKQIRALASARPFGDETPSSYVMFLADKPPRPRLKELLQLDVADDLIEPVGADLAVQYPTGFHRARLTVARVESILGVPATLRNWRTVVRLGELAAAVD
jgi:uncharacterized protein (DUF1697 family)